MVVGSRCVSEQALIKRPAAVPLETVGAFWGEGIDVQEGGGNKQLGRDRNKDRN